MVDQPVYRPELVVYVVWHPEFPAGREFARFLSDQLTRDSKEPLSRGMGIPVYLRTSLDSETTPEPIPFDQARHTVVVLLVDDQMVLSREAGWGKYAGDLVASAKDDVHQAHRILPVKLSNSAFTLNTDLRAKNFLPLDTVLPIAQQKQRLLIGLLHDLCRLFSNCGSVDYEAGMDSITDPVRVFLSHAKKDGVKLTEQFKAFIQSELQLDTFFDKNGIYYADDFAVDLEARVKDSAVLILHTDAYSTREWCQKEVLFAKKYLRPVLVLHKIEVGEVRSFPYLGNVPTIRWKDDTSIEEIIGRLLVEVLRFCYFPINVTRLGELFGINTQPMKKLACTPELVNLVPAAASPRTIVYPDPPLGRHETDLLADCDPNSQLTTPMFLLAKSGQAAVKQKSDDQRRLLVGMSLSPTIQKKELFSAELQRLGFLDAHFDDAIYELARYLLASGFDLAYGGDLREGGFTESLHGLAGQYGEQTQDPTLRLENFLAWVSHIGEPIDRMLQFQASARQHRLPLPADVVTDLQVDPKKKPTFVANSPESDYLNARCFTAMREAMTEKISARVLLGGPLAGYGGCYPGLVEEAYLAMKANRPVYLIGAFGGCTRAIIDAVEGRQPDAITLAGQTSLDETFRRENPEKAKTPYAQRVTDFNTRATKLKIEPIDYNAVQSVFASTGANNLAVLCANNGLTPQESRRLFETPHIAEMIYLVLKGLRAVVA